MKKKHKRGARLPKHLAWTEGKTAGTINFATSLQNYLDSTGDGDPLDEGLRGFLRHVVSMAKSGTLVVTDDPKVHFLNFWGANNEYKKRSE